MHEKLKQTIESAWDRRDTLDRKDHGLREAVEQVIDLLDGGTVRVAQPGPPDTGTRGQAPGWIVNQIGRASCRERV